MDEQSQRVFHANSSFEFTSHGCDCEVDVAHPSKGIKKYTFRLYPKTDVIYYAYISGRGLVSKRRDGTLNGHSILPDLLAIKEGDVDAVKSFIEQHGFFLPLDPNEDNAIDAELLFCLINRLKAVTSLMCALGEPIIDSKRVLALTLFLLLAETTEIQMPNYESPFPTCSHELTQIWNGVYAINEVNLQGEGVDGAIDEGRFVVDSVRPPKTWIQASEYNDIVGVNHQNVSNIKSNATYLFRNALTVPPHCRLAIDFLYHFCKEVGNIKSWSCNGDLHFADAPPEDEKFRTVFDKQLQSALIVLAKHTLKTEIEYNLGGVVPSYDTDTMMPSWRVEYLLAGLYFSVFYMRPKIELYRICANPNCELPFLVKTTSSKQKYCQSACTNAMAQRNHRRKVKADAEKPRPHSY